MNWQPIDINLWERDGWLLSKNGDRCYWLMAPNTAEFGPFNSQSDTQSAVMDLEER